jgi:hypothetical protein
MARGYAFAAPALVLTALYVASLWLVREKKISLLAQRRIWNVFLLASFLVSAGLGVLLLFRINYGVGVPLPFNSLYWHVEAGVAMTVVGVFHALWHLPYFKSMVKKG